MSGVGRKDIGGVPPPKFPRQISRRGANGENAVAEDLSRRRGNCGGDAPIAFLLIPKSQSQLAAAAGYGFRLSPDIEPIPFHPALADLFLQAANPESVYLKRFELLLPTIAKHSCSTMPRSRPQVTLPHQSVHQECQGGSYQEARKPGHHINALR